MLFAEGFEGGQALFPANIDTDGIGFFSAFILVGFVSGFSAVCVATFEGDFADAFCLVWPDGHPDVLQWYIGPSFCRCYCLLAWNGSGFRVLEWFRMGLL